MLVRGAFLKVPKVKVNWGRTECLMLNYYREVVYNDVQKSPDNGGHFKACYNIFKRARISWGLRTNNKLHLFWSHWLMYTPVKPSLQIQDNENIHHPPKFLPYPLKPSSLTGASCLIPRQTITNPVFCHCILICIF